ncbi:hypothetical protein [Sinomicrobium weinanense]|uniref:Uncharacterized protein n=1 Tax=Sinomicrobium weinanense TaxID=2842200 RepID=A0A926JQ23_9FLAO|nr:hypothetical protein [Sinomicrobium weinanense]MBC9795228.1 hypothetical protein [Sinomicrobium weinanense]MBU3122005.1 hypothetical protein [Sinomicrobium weinanense]
MEEEEMSNAMPGQEAATSFVQARADSIDYNSFVYDDQEEVSTEEVVVKEVVIWITDEIATDIEIDWQATSQDATHIKIEYEPASSEEATHKLQGDSYVPATEGATHKKLDEPRYKSVTEGATHKGTAKMQPDVGYYNDIEGYDEDGIFYAKKNSSGANKDKTTFPIYKAYIYKGDGIGKAKEKLEEDIDNDNKDQAESEHLYFARHSGGVLLANRTYFKTFSCLSPTGRHGQPDYYQLMFREGSNSGRVSYRYRIVIPEANYSSNLLRTTGSGDNVQDISEANEHKHGDMIFLTQRDIEVGENTITTDQRDASSFDPWKSKDMRGCHGVKTESGGYVNNAHQYQVYKNKYHAVNTWVEEKVPELKGIYGRRGFSDNTDSSDAKIKMEEPTDIEVEYKAWIKVDPLPDVDHILGISSETEEEVTEETVTEEQN